MTLQGYWVMATLMVQMAVTVMATATATVMVMVTVAVTTAPAKAMVGVMVTAGMEVLVEQLRLGSAAPGLPYSTPILSSSSRSYTPMLPTCLPSGPVGA